MPSTSSHPVLPPEISTALSAATATQQTILPASPALDNALAASTAAGLPPIAISPLQGAHLALLCRMLKAKRVLEVGTLGGYSTLWFAGSGEEVRVTSIEVDEGHREVAERNIAAAGEGVSERVDIILGQAVEVLRRLLETEGEGAFDFVFIDADWEGQGRYFEYGVQLARKGGVVYVDNALRNVTEEGDRSLVEVVGRLVREGRVRATLVPTLGTHKVGRGLGEVVDGFVMGFVL